MYIRHTKQFFRDHYAKAGMCFLLLLVSSFPIIGGKLDIHRAKFGKNICPEVLLLYLMYHKRTIINHFT